MYKLLSWCQSKIYALLSLYVFSLLPDVRRLLLSSPVMVYLNFYNHNYHKKLINKNIIVCILKYILKDIFEIYWLTRCF